MKIKCYSKDEELLIEEDVQDEKKLKSSIKRLTKIRDDLKDIHFVDVYLPVSILKVTSNIKCVKVHIEYCKFWKAFDFYKFIKQIKTKLLLIISIHEDLGTLLTIIKFLMEVFSNEFFNPEVRFLKQRHFVFLSMSFLTRTHLMQG